MRTRLLLLVGCGLTAALAWPLSAERSTPVPEYAPAVMQVPGGAAAPQAPAPAQGAARGGAQGAQGGGRGRPQDALPLYNAIADSGMLFVAAAGNDGDDSDTGQEGSGGELPFPTTPRDTGEESP